MISSTVASDDAAESLELTKISSARPRPRNDVPTDTLARKQLGTGNASIMRSCQEIQSGPLRFSLQGDSEAVTDNKSVGYTTNSNDGKDLSLKQNLRKTGCISSSAADCIQVGGAPIVVVPSAPFQDSTYCSVDDIEDISSDTCAAAASPMTFNCHLAQVMIDKQILPIHAMSFGIRDRLQYRWNEMMEGTIDGKQVRSHKKC